MIVYRVCLWYPSLITHVFSICVPYAPPSSTHIPLDKLVEYLPNFRYQLQLSSGEVEKHLKPNKADMKLFINGLFGGRGPNGEPGFRTDTGIQFDNLQKLGKTKLLSEEELDYYAAEYAHNGLHGPCNWYRTRDQNYKDELEIKNKHITIPVLFVGALKDPTIPRGMYESLSDILPNLTLRTVDTSHWAMAEDPVNVNKVIEEWIKEVVFAGKTKI
jgi:pimeloyl-ACP methyl ester carboxylesterase